MRQIFLNAILIVGISCQSGIAEDPPPEVAATVTTLSADVRGPGTDRSQSVGQLLNLVDELEKAGDAIKAAQVRAQARDRVIEEHLVERKAAELESLQKELDRLRKLTGAEKIVKVRLLAISVDRTRLGDLAEEFDRLMKDPMLISDLSNIRRDSPLFQELARRRAIDYLATPTLTAISGDLARLHLGGEVGIPLPGKREDGTRDTRMEFVGIQAEVLPTVRSGGQIHLQVKLRKSALQTVIPNDDGSPLPIVNVTSMENDATLNPGQVIVLGGTRTICESEWLPSSIAQTIRQIVQLVNHDKRDDEPMKLVPDPVLKKTEDVETQILVSVELIDPPPPDNPFSGQRANGSPRKLPERNYLRDDLQYYPAGPEFRRQR